MVTDFLVFIEESWNLIVNNSWIFIIYGVFLFVIGWSASWGIHSYFLECKLHNIPEREQLLAEIEALRGEVEDVKAQLHRQEMGDLIHESIHNDSKKETIGDIMIRNR